MCAYVWLANCTAVCVTCNCTQLWFHLAGRPVVPHQGGTDAAVAENPGCHRQRRRGRAHPWGTRQGWCEYFNALLCSTLFGFPGQIVCVPSHGVQRDLVSTGKIVAWRTRWIVQENESSRRYCALVQFHAIPLVWDRGFCTRPAWRWAASAEARLQGRGDVIPRLCSGHSTCSSILDLW